MRADPLAGRHRSLRARSRSLVAAGVLVGLLAAGCGSTDDTQASDDGAPPSTAAAPTVTVDDAVFPLDDWEVADPADLGLDGAPLTQLSADLGELNSNCVLVVKDGRVVEEAYFDGTDADTDQEVWSASKSVTSTLVGIAQDQGLLSLDDPASTWIDEWVGTPSESVTVRNLVANDSGRYWDYGTDYIQMAAAAPDKTAFAIGLDQQHEPGAHWEYNNSAIQTLEQVLEESTGQDMAEFAEAELFGPLGMDVEIKRDVAGNPLAFMGVQAGCRDMARFGYLFLRDGRWGDEQVVSSEWVEEATAAPSQDLNERYGYLWWRGFEGLPDDAYAALGLGNQIVLVLPSQDMVVVRLGVRPPADGGVDDQGAMVGTMAEAALAASGGAG